MKTTTNTRAAKRYETLCEMIAADPFLEFEPAIYTERDALRFELCIQEYVPRFGLLPGGHYGMW